MSSTTVHILTDVGVKDTDDELLMSYLMTLKDIPFDLLFVFTGSDGLSAPDALAYWVREFESNVLQKMNAKSSVHYTTLTEYAANESNACDYYLQIAPGNDYEGKNLTVNEKYVFAGDAIAPRPGPDSFNSHGSEDILEKFFYDEKLVDISSKKMATMRFNDELLSKFDGPFLENIVFTAFLLAFGRMHPGHPVACLYAEGLINPLVGRGVNYSSIMKIADNLDLDFGPDAPESCSIMAEKYFEDITASAKGVVICNEIYNKDSVKNLVEINCVLFEIHRQATSTGWFTSSPGTDIFAENGSVFYSDFNIYTIPESIRPSWEYFKKNSTDLIECFNPVYDLYAGYILVGLLKGEDRSEDTVEEFQKKVVQEFN